MKLLYTLFICLAFQNVIAGEFKELSKKEFKNLIELQNYYENLGGTNTIQTINMKDDTFYCCVRDIAKGGSLEEVAVFKKYNKNIKLLIHMPFGEGEKRFLAEKDSINIQMYSIVEQGFTTIISFYLPAE